MALIDSQCDSIQTQLDRACRSKRHQPDLLLWQVLGLQAGALTVLKAALRTWLASLQGAMVAGAEAPVRPPVSTATPDLAAGDIGPRHFDDAALTTITGLSPAMACECPRHVAELLMQLSNFKAHSADSAIRSPADAELPVYLRRVAGASQALFEAAF